MRNRASMVLCDEYLFQFIKYNDTHHKLWPLKKKNKRYNHSLIKRYNSLSRYPSSENKFKKKTVKEKLSIPSHNNRLSSPKTKNLASKQRRTRGYPVLVRGATEKQDRERTTKKREREERAEGEFLSVSLLRTSRRSSSTCSLVCCFSGFMVLSSLAAVFGEWGLLRTPRYSF